MMVGLRLPVLKSMPEPYGKQLLRSTSNLWLLSLFVTNSFNYVHEFFVKSSVSPLSFSFRYQLLSPNKMAGRG